MVAKLDTATVRTLGIFLNKLTITVLFIFKILAMVLTKLAILFTDAARVLGRFLSKAATTVLLTLINLAIARLKFTVEVILTVKATK